MACRGGGVVGCEEMQQFALESRLDGCVLGEEGLCQSRWGYILCFMVARGRINHCFIKRPPSLRPPPPHSLQRDIPLFSLSSLSIFLCPALFSVLTFPTTISNLASITPSTSVLPAPLSFPFSQPFSPFSVPSAVSTTCHCPSTQSGCETAVTQ